jgi:hypothetical protein
MDISAVIATLTSVLAIGVTVMLVRITRHERQRAEARVAALVTLSARPAAGFGPAPVRLEPRERPAPAARHAVAPRATNPQPAAASDPPRRELRLNAAEIEIFRDASSPPLSADVSLSAAPSLFEPAVPRGRSSLAYIAAAAVAVAGVLALALGWAFSVSEAPAEETTATISRPAPAAPAPLALLALRHEQGADGTLVISGIVRNPAESVARQKLFAAASLVDAGGTVVATARAPLDFTLLGPGEESPFVVRVTGAGNIARYRIGFRDADGGPISHIDRR